MNEQLQGAVAQILEKAISGIDSSVEFMQSELPDVVNQLLTWSMIESLIIGVIGLSVSLAIVFIICKGSSSKPGKGESTFVWSWCGILERHEFNPFVLFLIMPFLFSSAATFKLLTALKIWIAPKIWLMEYAASLVK